MARYAKAQTEANRERIVAEAGRLLRERGLDGVGVAELMAAAGLTHGGFYRHFPSKQDLAVEAVETLGLAVVEQWRETADRARQNGENPAAVIVAGYLTDKHRDAVGAGCAIAAMGSDLARLPGDLRNRVKDSIEGMVNEMASELPPDLESPQERATALFAAMIGALLLSRLGVSGADPAIMTKALVEAFMQSDD